MKRQTPNKDGCGSVADEGGSIKGGPRAHGGCIACSDLRDITVSVRYSSSVICDSEYSDRRQAANEFRVQLQSTSNRPFDFHLEDIVCIYRRHAIHTYIRNSTPVERQIVRYVQWLHGCSPLRPATFPDQ
nr:hypothetical protein CFP56_44310 [Quercus suber]